MNPGGSATKPAPPAFVPSRGRSYNSSMLSFADAAVIVGLGVLLFGSQKIPELARAIRRSGREFKDGHAEALGSSQAAPGDGGDLPPTPPATGG